MIATTSGRIRFIRCIPCAVLSSPALTLLLSPTAGARTGIQPADTGVAAPRVRGCCQACRFPLPCETADVGLARFRLGTERRGATRWIGAMLLVAIAAGAALLAAQAAR